MNCLQRQRPHPQLDRLARPDPPNVLLGHGDLRLESRRLLDHADQVPLLDEATDLVLRPGRGHHAGDRAGHDHLGRQGLEVGQLLADDGQVGAGGLHFLRPRPGFEHRQGALGVAQLLVPFGQLGRRLDHTRRLPRALAGPGLLEPGLLGLDAPSGLQPLRHRGGPLLAQAAGPRRTSSGRT